MNVHYLLCNVSKCRKELKTQAWATYCSHIFCLEHGEVCGDKEKCLVCETQFSNRYDIVLIDLNPTEQYKMMVLAGFRPEIIMDVASKAIMFWTYQVYQEKMMQDSSIKNAKQHADELSYYCENITSKHKLEVQKLLRTIDNLERELDEKGKHVEELIVQLAEKSHIIKDQQIQYDTLKRSVPNNLQSKFNNYDDMFNDKHEQNKRNYHLKNWSQGRTPRQHNFVFQPKMAQMENASPINMFKK